MNKVLLLVVVIVGIVITFTGTILFLMVVQPWLRALGHGAPVSMLSIIGMRLRGNPPLLVIDAHIALHRAKLPTTISEVENAYIDNRTRVRNSQDLVELVKRKRAGNQK